MAADCVMKLIREMRNEETLAKFIGRHHPCACVELGDMLTVCSVWGNSKRFGWRIERIPATWSAVRTWLGY